MKNDFSNNKEERVRDLARKLDRVKVSQELKERLMKRVRGEGAEPSYTGAIRRYPVPLVASLVMVSVSFFIVFAYMFSPVSPMIHDLKGMVKIYDSSGDAWRIARDKERVRIGDMVKTFGDGRADISVKGLYSMRLRRDSEIRIARLNPKIARGGIKYYLAKGQVLAYYAGKHDEKENKFTIETDEAYSIATGTDFTVRAFPDAGKTWVGVLDGVVKVLSKDLLFSSDMDTKVYVEPRHKTEVRKMQKPSPPERMVEEEWLDMSELYSIGTKPQVALIISSAPTRVRELLSLVPLYISDEKEGILPDKLKDMVKLFNDAVKEHSPEKHKEILKEFRSIVDEYPDPSYDVQFLLFIGAYQYHLGQYKGSIETFKEVVARYPASRLASIAQCAIGIIYEERIGDVIRAKEAYQAVLAKYPQSPEAREASEGLSRSTNR